MIKLITSENYNKSGIYAICNKWNGKMYIGSSKNLGCRISQHKSKLKKNKHHSVHLQRAWNKYPENYFKYYILEYCDEIKLQEREQYYLNLLCLSNLKTKDFKNYSYNIKRFAHQSINRSKYGIIFEVDTIEGKVINKYFNMELASKKKKKSFSAISNAVRNKSISDGSYFLKEEDVNSVLKTLNIKIYQFDKNLNIVNVFKTEFALREYLINNDMYYCNVEKCLHYERVSAYGFYWGFKKKHREKISKNKGIKKGFKHIKIYDKNLNLYFKSALSYYKFISPDCSVSHFKKQLKNNKYAIIKV